MRRAQAARWQPEAILAPMLLLIAAALAWARLA